jgi:hypothetical protein
MDISVFEPTEDVMSRAHMTRIQRKQQDDWKNKGITVAVLEESGVVGADSADEDNKLHCVSAVFIASITAIHPQPTTLMWIGLPHFLLR